MRNWTVIVAGAALSLFVANAAEAADPAPAPPACTKDNAPVPPDYLQLAGRVLITTKADETMTAAIDASLPPLIAVLRATSPNLTDAQLNAVHDDVRAEMLSHVGELGAAEACVYVHHFSRDELRQLDTFYASPLGRKLLKEMPAMVAENVALARNWAQTAGKAALDHVLDKMRKDGVKI